MKHYLLLVLVFYSLTSPETITHAEQTPLSETDRMVFVKGGCFDMGDVFGDGDPDEIPVHRVCADDFYIGRYEVTQNEWTKVMGNNPSSFVSCDDCPV